MPPEQATRNAKKYASRQALLERLPKNSYGVEIGVYKGDFSQHILDTVIPSRLTLVDPWLFCPDKIAPTFGSALPVLRPDDVQAAGGAQGYLDQMHQSVVERYQQINTVEVVRLRSEDYFDQLRTQDQKPDWIYIDGDHSYEAVRDDVAGAWECLEEGGIICGDDFRFAQWDTKEKTVKRAVKEFLETRRAARKSMFRKGGQWGFQKLF